VTEDPHKPYLVQFHGNC